jgi:hypothetical protein
MYAPEEDIPLIYQAAVPIVTHQHSNTPHFLLLLFRIIGLAGVESMLYVWQERMHRSFNKQFSHSSPAHFLMCLLAGIESA